MSKKKIALSIIIGIVFIGIIATIILGPTRVFNKVKSMVQVEEEEQNRKKK